jgi:hypothetical protein
MFGPGGRRVQLGGGSTTVGSWWQINFPSAPWTSEKILYFDLLYINIF